MGAFCRIDRRFDLKWAEDESILRMFLRRIDDRRSPISNEIAILNIFIAKCPYE